MNYNRVWQYRGQERPPFAKEPRPGQESVWDYPRPPAIVIDKRRVEVRLGDFVIADSRQNYRILETASPPTFYIPPRSVHMELLEPCPGSSVCEWKGVARYWALKDHPNLFAIGRLELPESQPRVCSDRRLFLFLPGQGGMLCRRRASAAATG